MGTHSHLVQFMAGTQIPSVNNMYEIFGKGPRKYLHKKGEVTRFQDELIIKLKQSPLFNLARFNYYKIDISLTFIIAREEYWRRDTDNMSKATLDAIQKATGINDNKYVRVIAEKQISPNSFESLLIVMVGYEPEQRVTKTKRRKITNPAPPSPSTVTGGSPEKEGARIGRNGKGTRHHPVES